VIPNGALGRSVPQDDSDRARRLITRRAAIQLGAGATAGAGAAAVVASSLGHPAVFQLDDAQPAFAPITSWPVPRMITRAQWGANEGLRRSGQEFDTSIAKIVVHHTGTPNEVTDYGALCRGILANETAGEYIDIAYNWLIDPNGNIYEGRWAQDYPAGARHTGERSGANVRGAHASYHNTRTIGVALMGNYDIAAPPPAMINALVTFLAWKCARWGLDPRARGLYGASNGAVENLFNVCGHRDTGPTACPGRYVQDMLPTIRNRAAGQVFGGGYWIASSTGTVLPFGGASNVGDVHGRRISAIAGHPSGNGYWLAAPDGAVYGFGAARYYGGMNGRRLDAPIVGMSAMPSGNGYWLVAGDGGIFTFGGARFHGSTGGMRLDAPVLGMLPTRTGNGYWLYAADGGIFSYGDAKFYGSTGGMRLWQPVVSMAARPQGDGYWLVAADGGVFSFGRAPFRGSAALYPSRSACVGMLPTTTGGGYVLLRRDGSVWAFGDAPYLGGANPFFGSTAIGIAGRLKPF
jgi:hypothetical protein